MIPDTNVGGKIATINEVSDDQETTFLHSWVQAGSSQPKRGQPEKVMFHSDRGSQYASRKKTASTSRNTISPASAKDLTIK